VSLRTLAVVLLLLLTVRSLVVRFGLGREGWRVSSRGSLGSLGQGVTREPRPPEDERADQPEDHEGDRTEDEPSGALRLGRCFFERIVLYGCLGFRLLAV
jgi:hypothetical protein